MIKKGKFAVVLMLAMALVAGCSGGNSGKSEESSILKVLYYDEQSFYNDYGMLYAALNPNVEVEVITQGNRWGGGEGETEEEREAKFQQLIDEKQPDVLFIDAKQYEKFSHDGKLLDLAPMIEQDKYNTETLLPGMLDYLKEKGGGTLFGLTPSYYSQALFYNKTLFEKHGVDLPTDRMTWEDVLARSARFPTDGSPEERIYGFKGGYDSSLFQLGMNIGSTLGLSFVDADGKQLMIDTPAWQNAFNTALQAQKSGTLYFQDNSHMSGNWNSYEEYLMRDPFISGRMAMMVEGTYMLDQLKQAKDALKDKIDYEWDLVTVPVDPNNPDYTTSTGFHQIFAINNKSTNSKEAWNFIKYIHGDDYARVKSKSYNSGNLSTRTGYFKDDEGHNLQAFYELKPSESSLYSNYYKLPSEFYMQFDSFVKQKLEPVMKDNASLEEALKAIQQEGQQLLMEAHKKQDEKKGTEQQGAASGVVEQSVEGSSEDAGGDASESTSSE
ncbi:ABC transporter substrate-binding protein [Paenibacillus pinihumi]|uniref:ABC transporter substrate-binding protein n=1 Tax=Paenibacillus pinihumi TaxID=669462 RepID=UPI0003FE3135|nr:ABC transporter substrate-binding protein [Paenibacillus pinihumi]